MKFNQPTYPITIEIENGNDAMCMKAIGKIAEHAIRSGDFIDKFLPYDQIGTLGKDWKDKKFYGVKLGDIYEIAKRLEKI